MPYQLGHRGYNACEIVWNLKYLIYYINKTLKTEQIPFFFCEFLSSLRFSKQSKRCTAVSHLTEKYIIPEMTPMEPYRSMDLSCRNADNIQHLPSPLLLLTPENDGLQSSSIRLCSTSRPHMRAFHLGWTSFFVAFYAWFAIPPLIPTIKAELELSSDQVNTSHIIAVSGTIFTRVIIGPLCDYYGPRRVQSILLLWGTLPILSAASMTSVTGFYLVRFFTGFIGGSFVCVTHWNTLMFTPSVIGTVNAIAAGWGNLGAGMAYLTLPSVFALFVHFGVADNVAWRVTMLLPCMLLLIFGFALWHCAEDTPSGNFKRVVRKDTSQWSSLRETLRNRNTLVLSVHYACTFGIELYVANAIGSYFIDEFQKEECDSAVNDCSGLTQTQSGCLASIAGLTNLFARAFGGYLSDAANRKYGIKGRIQLQGILLVFQACGLFAFSTIGDDIVTAALALLCFMVMVQAAEGSTFSLVPYVAPDMNGTVSGVVGSAGNLGAVVFGILFSQIGDATDGFFYLSFIVLLSSVLCFFLNFTPESTTIMPQRNNVQI